jgi:hypothetical protein
MLIKEVTNRQNLRDFISLPFKIHKHHKLWVPPLLADEYLYFDKSKNPSFKKNDAVMFVAYHDQEPAGRIMAIINHACNKKNNLNNVRFACLECYDDSVTASALMDRVEVWGRENGMSKMVGPLGFSDQDPEGYIIEGFEFGPTLSTYHNFEYIPKILEQLGYHKEIDYVVYQVDLTKPVCNTLEKIYERIQRKSDIKLISFRSKKELKPFLKPVMQIMNETFTDLYGFEPMTESEIDFLLKRFAPVLDQKFVFTASKNGTLIGFLMAIPNLNDGLIRCNGRLFPFGLFHLKRAAKKSKQLDLLAAGIKKEYRGHGFETIGLMSVIKAARESGYRVMDSHHELEDNTNVRNIMERFGGKLRKKYRVYQKMLA